jgi:hypothetical protein
MVEQHCKVLFVRFDVRFPRGTIHDGPNTEISRLMKELKSYYKAQRIATHYIWAREQWSSDAPHYHVVLLLNGSRVQNPMGVWVEAAEIWSRITNGPSALAPFGRRVNARHINNFWLRSAGVPPPIDGSVRRQALLVSSARHNIRHDHLGIPNDNGCASRAVARSCADAPHSASCSARSHGPSPDAGVPAASGGG